MRFGEYLTEKNLVSKDALFEALRAQRFTKERIGRLLRDLGHLDQMGLNRSLWFFLKPECPYELEELKKMIQGRGGDSRSELSRLAGGMNVQKTFLVNRNETRLELVGTFFRDELIEELERCTCLDVRFYTIRPEQFAYLEKIVVPGGQAKAELSLTKKLGDDERLSLEGAYSALFQESLKQAVALDASDVHMLPVDDGAEVRFRLHGELKLWKKLGPEHRDAFFQSAKQALGLDLAISGRPQDGRASYKSLKLDIRVNALPTLYGDKIVLRLLPQEKKFDLDGMGLPSDTLQTLRSAIGRKQGLILISGPTGSGKTTTLYSLLAALDRDRLNITTLENPVEFRLPGITQVDVGRARGVSFADSLRALMRQDPDVILIGEIRDRETADMALQAGATGHLVLSTIHANGAREVVDRLVNLKIERQSIEENLKLSAAQRLVRLLCQNCRAAGSDADRSLLPTELKDGAFWKKGPGCDVCGFSGVSGRRPLVEFLSGEDIGHVLRGDSVHFINIYSQVLSLAAKGEVCIYEAISFA